MADKLKTQVSFEQKNGRTFSRRKEFYENGVLAREGLYASGVNWGWTIPAGVIKSYSRNGKLIAEEYYDEHGNHDGESVYYNEEGAIIKKVLYVKDKKVKEQFFDANGEVVVT